MEALDAKALEKLIGFKPEKRVEVVLHEDHTFWRHGDLWYDYGSSDDRS